MNLQYFFLYSLILVLTACQNNKPIDPAPNIIYILADDLGYGDISSLNPEGKIQTPNIDLIGKKGIKFTDAHSTSAVCTPTRYSTLTGRYNWRSRLKNGVLTGKDKALIPNDRTTVASLLKNQGYRTGFIGKWHLGWDWTFSPEEDGSAGWGAKDCDYIDFSKPVSNNPNDLGFDYAYGHAASLDICPYVYVENGKVTAEPDRMSVDTGKYTWWRRGPTGADFVHEQVTPHFFEKSFDFIKNKPEDQAFFLYLALPSPHTPILPTKEWLGKSGLNPYADFVLLIDEYIGRLHQLLEEQGLTQNTLLIFTSDNGCSPEADFEVLAEKGHDPSYIYRGHKADIYEGGHRVPYLLQWPAKIEADQSSGALVSASDLLATCADIVDYELKDNEGEDSYSILKKIAGTEGRPDLIHHSIEGAFAIRKGDWKLIMHAGSGGWSYPRQRDLNEMKETAPKIQLYNLAKDPAESNNLEAENPEKVEELEALLVSYILNGRSTPGEKQENDPIEKEWKQLWFIE